tara:strand:- start:15750 stop:16544 length:795 start_codon:yes stop_codon:yes gene_type:complete
MSGSGENIATKSKWKSPDKFFPVVVDNFFDNPESLVEYSKTLPKEVVGNQPGKRTKHFWEIDQVLHNAIIRKILSCYYDLDYTNISWKLSNMNFHEIPRYSENKNDDINKGWIHQDNGVGSTANDDDIAGLIYLNKDIDEDSGTSLFALKPNFQYNFATQSPMGRTEEQARGEGWAIHRENFIEKIRFQNVFNRMIMYDANEFHAANSYYTEGDPRLTLVFFIGGIEGTEFPRERIKREDIIIESRIEKSMILNQQNRIYSNVK